MKKIIYKLKNKKILVQGNEMQKTNFIVAAKKVGKKQERLNYFIVETEEFNKVRISATEFSEIYNTSEILGLYPIKDGGKFQQMELFIDEIPELLKYKYFPDHEPV